MNTKHSARILIGTLAATALFTLTACGSSGPSSASGVGGASMWALTTGDQPVIEAAVDSWNEENPDAPIDLQFFAADAYKQKIRTAIGAGQAPTLIYSWGGGVLDSYVKAGAVEDLSHLIEENPEISSRYLNSVAQNGVIDGATYALPLNKVNIVNLYYNKALFDEAGVQAPKSWADLMNLVPVFADKGIAPIGLGGQSKWPELMWLEYLVDREGGSEVFERILAGDDDAWSDPAITSALTKIQELVDAGGFQDSFASTASNSGSELALMYTGKAAMVLQLSAQYQTMKTGAADFVASGDLGYVPFPTVDGGAGDPSFIVGTPSNFFSVSSSASDGAKQTAEDFLATGLFSDSYTDDVIATGAVPPLTGIEDKLAATEDADFLTYTYELASEASTFQLSWDQALEPALADTMLTQLEQIFLKQSTPQQFVDAMNEASRS